MERIDPHPQRSDAHEGGTKAKAAPTARPARRSVFVRWAPLVLGLLAAEATSNAMSRKDDGSMRVFGAHPTLLGQPVPTGDGAASQVRSMLLEHLSAPMSLQLAGRLVTSKRVTAKALGARIDEPRLEALMRDLRDPNSALLRVAPGNFALPLPLALDSKAAFDAMVALKEDLDLPPQDAKLDLDQRKVIPETTGLRIDVYSTMATLDEALRKGDRALTISAVEVAPELTKEKLANVELTDTLGYFETKYATDHKHVDRTFNLRLAASRLNGKVILPGETFDFNVVVGPRDEAHGYRVAKVIADGELVDGMGGGTCQIAGTLHGAALFAGLEIVKRSPHTRPSYYIKMGLDAAVAYPGITLKLRNPFSYPVVLKETVVGGVVRAEVLGAKRTRVVTFIRKIEEVLPFPQREVPDEKLPEGKRVITQRGIPGFKVRRYRIVREGPNAVREKTDDVYPPTLQIVHVGTAPSGKSKIIEDDHPEYVADVYLAITQGPSVGKPDTAGMDSDELKSGPAPSGMEEVRVPGETGTKGWSKKYASEGGIVVAKPISESEVQGAIASAAADSAAAEDACDDGQGGGQGGDCKGVAKKAGRAKRRKK